MSVLFLSVALSAQVRPAGDGRQAWPCAIAALLIDGDGRKAGGFLSVIRAPDNAPRVEAAQTRVHGIGHRAPMTGGVDELMALAMVAGLERHVGSPRPGFAALARYAVCWDDVLVKTVITHALARHGEPARAFVRPGLEFIGLQGLATPFCKFPPLEDDDVSGCYRAPSMDEAAAALLGLPVRPLPYDLDDDLSRLRALDARLRELNAIESAA